MSKPGTTKPGGASMSTAKRCANQPVDKHLGAIQASDFDRQLPGVMLVPSDRVAQDGHGVFVATSDEQILGIVDSSTDLPRSMLVADRNILTGGYGGGSSQLSTAAQ